jgi:hypothetical protein
MQPVQGLLQSIARIGNQELDSGKHLGLSSTTFPHTSKELVTLVCGVGATHPR